MQEERGCHPHQPQQHIFSQSSSATSTFVQQTFQQPQQPVPAAREYILTIPETQMPASQVIQPAQQSQVAAKGQQQQSRGQPTSLPVVKHQQAGPSRQLSFTLTLTKQFKPPSVASGTGEERQHNTSGLSGLFGNLPSVLSYQQINTPQPFSPPDTLSLFQPPMCSYSSSQPSLSLLHSQPMPNSSSSRNTALVSSWSFPGPMLSNI